MQTRTSRVITLEHNDSLILCGHHNSKVSMTISKPRETITLEFQPVHLESLELLVAKLRAIESEVPE